MKKCSVRRKILCAAIKALIERDILAGQNDMPFGKGIGVCSFKTKGGRATKFPGMYYKYGRAQISYIWFNYCPFCGGKLK